LESSEVDILLHSTPKRAPNRLHEDFFGVMRISSQSNSASHILAHRLGLARCGLGLCFGLVKLCVKITLHIGARVPTPNAQCFTPGDTAEDQTTADQQSISETQETLKKRNFTINKLNILVVDNRLRYHDDVSIISCSF